MVIEDAMNREMFPAYVAQCLVPKLRRDDIVVLGNPLAHKVAGTHDQQQACAAPRQTGLCWYVPIRAAS
jgi:hypothetical protein